MAGGLPFQAIQRAQVVDREGRLDVDKFLALHNRTLSAIHSALSHGLTFSENVRAEWVERQVKTKSIVADTFPIYLSPTRVRNPASVWIGRCREDVANPAAMTSGVWADWERDADGRIRIKYVSGLTASRTYDIAFLIVED